jgi:hypothetical protein
MSKRQNKNKNHEQKQKKRSCVLTAMMKPFLQKLKKLSPLDALLSGWEAAQNLTPISWPKTSGLVFKLRGLGEQPTFSTKTAKKLMPKAWPAKWAVVGDKLAPILRPALKLRQSQRNQSLFWRIFLL